jgi:hypothetical protein
MTADDTAPKQRGRPFPKGQSGNANGRPFGSRSKATIALEQLLDGEGEAITRKAIDAALAGDAWAIRLCIERLIPIRKDRVIQFPMPSLEKPADATKAMDAIFDGVANGEVTVSEAAELGRMIENYTRALEVNELNNDLL